MTASRSLLIVRKTLEFGINRPTHFGVRVDGLPNILSESKGLYIRVLRTVLDKNVTDKKAKHYFKSDICETLSEHITIYLYQCFFKVLILSFLELTNLGHGLALNVTYQFSCITCDILFTLFLQIVVVYEDLSCFPEIAYFYRILFIDLIGRFFNLEDMKSGVDKTDRRIDLLGHVPNQNVRIVLEVITFLTLTASHGIFDRFYYTKHGRIVDSRLFCDPPVELT